jgi:glycosyltransferase involved in cell wall biosynthesis
LNVVVYIGRIARGATSGVARYATNLVRALADRGEDHVTLLGAAEVIGTYADLGEVRLVDEAGIQIERSCLSRGNDLLIQVHPFQRRLVDLPTVVVVHDLNVYDAAWSYGNTRHRSVRSLHKNLIRADAVVSHFPHVIKRVVEVEPLAAGKTVLTVSPLMIDDLGLDGEAVAAAQRRFGDGRPSILFPARRELFKNHWNLLTAVHEVQREGYDLRLICPGGTAEPDSWAATLERRVRYLGLSYVHFLGHVPGKALRALYELAVAVVSPSLAAGGATLAQEALACDRAIACSTNPGAVAHLFRMQLAVPTFDPFDVDAIAVVLKRLADDPDAVVAGYEPAHKTIAAWTWDRLADEIASSIGAVSG